MVTGHILGLILFVSLCGLSFELLSSKKSKKPTHIVFEALISYLCLNYIILILLLLVCFTFFVHSKTSVSNSSNFLLLIVVYVCIAISIDTKKLKRLVPLDNELKANLISSDYWLKIISIIALGIELLAQLAKNKSISINIVEVANGREVLGIFFMLLFPVVISLQVRVHNLLRENGRLLLAICKIAVLWMVSLIIVVVLGIPFSLTFRLNSLEEILTNGKFLLSVDNLNISLFLFSVFISYWLFKFILKHLKSFRLEGGKFDDFHAGVLGIVEDLIVFLTGIFTLIDSVKLQKPFDSLLFPTNYENWLHLAIIFLILSLAPIVIRLKQLKELNSK